MDETRLTRPVRGVEIFERRVGSGPPVVVLHGGPGAHHDYLLPGFDALARDRELIYYDQRGGGRSPVARDVSVGWREHVADLEALRRHLEAGTTHSVRLLLGWAPGHALRRRASRTKWSESRWYHLPRRGARPASNSRRAFGPVPTTPEIEAERRALRASGLRERDLAAYQRRLFELAVAGYFHDPARVGDLTPFRITERTQREVWESLGDYDLRPALRRARDPGPGGPRRR